MNVALYVSTKKFKVDLLCCYYLIFGDVLQREVDVEELRRLIVEAYVKDWNDGSVVLNEEELFAHRDAVQAKFILAYQFVDSREVLIELIWVDVDYLHDALGCYRSDRM